MARKPLISKSDIAAAFVGTPRIVSPEKLAEILGRKVKTIYFWISKGRLDGSFRKRGKHLLIWRDRAIALLFNGPEWHEK